MNRRPSHPGRGADAQRGFTLIGILVMIVALAFLALGAMGSGVLQERMGGNARDRNVALQAGEAALRDAEADIQAHLGPDSAFTAGCDGGLCLPPSMSATAASSAPVWQNLDWSSKSRSYGSKTGAPALTGPGGTALASQPAYIVELLPQLPPSPGDSACTTCAAPLPGQAFRITVRATGVRSSTVVMLQSTYVKQ